jgi:hypothetical protein
MHAHQVASVHILFHQAILDEAFSGSLRGNKSGTRHPGARSVCQTHKLLSANTLGRDDDRLSPIDTKTMCELEEKVGLA